MSTKTSRVKFGMIVSATVKVTNETDADRQFDINADVAVNGNSADGFNSGRVRKTDGTDAVATFDAWGDSNLNVNYSTADEEECVGALRAIKAFIADVRSEVANEDVLKLS